MIIWICCIKHWRKFHIQWWYVNCLELAWPQLLDHRIKWVASLNVGLKKTTSDQWQQVDVIDSLKNVWYLAFQSLTVSQANFLARINFFRLFSSCWNTIFPCWNSNTLSNLFRNYLKFFLTFCCSSRVLSSLATHTWEVLLNLIWLNARLKSFGDICQEFLIPIFLYIYRPSTRPKQKKSFY